MSQMEFTKKKNLSQFAVKDVMTLEPTFYSKLDSRVEGIICRSHCLELPLYLHI